MWNLIWYEFVHPQNFVLFSFLGHTFKQPLSSLSVFVGIGILWKMLQTAGSSAWLP